jgi:hypothetical protein
LRGEPSSRSPWRSIERRHRRSTRAR